MKSINGASSIKRLKPWLWGALAVASLWFLYKTFFALWFFGLLPHQATTAPVKEKFQISDFSPDGKKLYLDYCDTSRNCRIGWLDLAAQHVSLFTPQGTQNVMSSPSSSDDGKQLAVVIKEATSNYETSQIGILDLEKNTYRPITKSTTFKEWPSFSHDGKKIIYGQANRKRGSGKTRYSEWDIYEVDIATGVERRLTDFCFFIIDRPQYLDDNKMFVFSGEAPSCNFPVRGNTGIEGYNSYKKLYQDNTIFMMNGAETTLKPLFTNGSASLGPTLSRDGKIFFISITNKMDGIKCCYYNYDLFEYENGSIHRLTNLKTMMSGLAVSSRGEWVAYLSDEQRNHNNELWMMDVKAGTHSRINLGESGKFSLINAVTN